jgi:hypothetical protein
MFGYSCRSNQSRSLGLVLRRAKAAPLNSRFSRLQFDKRQHWSAGLRTRRPPMSTKELFATKSPATGFTFRMAGRPIPPGRDIPDLQGRCRRCVDGRGRPERPRFHAARHADSGQFWLAPSFLSGQPLLDPPATATDFLHRLFHRSGRSAHLLRCIADLVILSTRHPGAVLFPSAAGFLLRLCHSKSSLPVRRQRTLKNPEVLGVGLAGTIFIF